MLCFFFGSTMINFQIGYYVNLYEHIMRRSDIIIKSLSNGKALSNVNHYTMLLLIHYTFNVYYPYEGFGEWDVDVELSEAEEYIKRIYPAHLSNIGHYIKELWDVR